MRALPLVLVIALAGPVAAAAAQAPGGQNGRIGYSAKRGDARAIYSRERTGTALRRLRVDAHLEQPAFSRRGRRVAFTRFGPFGRQIWVSYLDGAGLRQVTDGFRDEFAAWSPEGEQLVFSRGRVGARDLYRVRADGTGARRLSYHAGDEHSPSWGPDGRIAFVRRTRAGDDIYIFDSLSGRARRLTRTRTREGFPDWSSSGRVLVVSRGRPGRRDLWLLRADGSKERRLTRVKGDEVEPAWSPDGSRIAFIHRRKGKRRVYFVKVRGRAVRRLPRRGKRVRRITTARSSPRQPTWQPTGLPPVIAAAGDIACDPDDPHYNGGAGRPGLCRQRLTSDLLLRMDLDAVLIPGDLQYPDGELDDFLAAFHPTWGRAKHLLRPVPGNHEYRVPGAAGYFDYFNGPGQAFGQAGARGAGWYSFDLGGWHVIALNSECAYIGGCGMNSAQIRWLRADLAANQARCTVAFWHRPRYTSGEHDAQGEMLAAWQVLYARGADLILNGHEHFYERFAPMTPTGAVDRARGIRQIIAGMGGRSRFRIQRVAPGSEARDHRTIGVLEVTLRPDGYDWRLRGAPSGRVADSGSDSCR